MNTGVMTREWWNIGEIRDMLGKEYDRVAQGLKKRIKMKKKKWKRKRKKKKKES